jgi:hypothetical protein
MFQKIINVIVMLFQIGLASGVDRTVVILSHFGRFRVVLQGFVSVYEVVTIS